METIGSRISGLEAHSENYVKAADLEAACIVDFDAAGQAMASGDHDGAKRIIDEIDNTVSDLRRTKSPNSLGIGYLASAYSGLNTIFSYPLTDISWLKANRQTLDGKINDLIKDLDSAKSALVTKELISNCSVLSKNVSPLKNMLNKIGEKL